MPLAARPRGRNASARNGPHHARPSVQHPNPVTITAAVAYLALAESDVPAVVAEMADRIASEFRGPLDAFTASARTGPPPEWVLSRRHSTNQQLAAWAVAECRDVAVQRAIYADPATPAYLHRALASSPHLPPPFRAEIRAAAVARSDDALVALLDLSTPFDEQYRALFARDGRLGAMDYTAMLRIAADPACTPEQFLALGRALVAEGELLRALGLFDTTTPASTATLAEFLSDLLPVLEAIDRSAHHLRFFVANWCGKCLISRSARLPDHLFLPLVALALRDASGWNEAQRWATTRAHLMLLLTTCIAQGGTITRVRESALEMIRGPRDPLVGLLVATASNAGIADYLQGEWTTCRSRSGWILPDAEQLAALLTLRPTRTYPLRVRAAAVLATQNHRLPEAYRQLLVTRVPGLAALVLQHPEERRLVWDRLSAATTNMTLALDQLSSCPHASLDEICQVVARLDRAPVHRLRPRTPWAA